MGRFKESKPRAAAIGTFDGVHKGHCCVLGLLKEHAQKKGLEPLAITFRNHPLEFISPDKAPLQLTHVSKKEKLIIENGVVPLVLDFDEEVRSSSAARWMEKLHHELGVRVLVVGYDNTFGCDGVNMSLEDYRVLGREIGIDVVMAGEVKGVSSSAIRHCIVSGEVTKAAEMLGRPYSISGNVVSGNRIGRSIGFPTANLEPPKRMAIPANGVYAVTVEIPGDGKVYPAMVNIGTRPTLKKGEDKVIECHVINWDGDLYGKNITVNFIERIRDEKKFDSLEELKRQLSSDMETVSEILKTK